jgi:hypothetical protein
MMKTPVAIPTAARVSRFTYAIRNIVAEAQKVEAAGRKVRYLNIGDPVAFGFNTPPHLLDAVIKAMRDGHNTYGPSAGIPEARTAVAAVCGKIEAELAELSGEDAREYLSSYGLKESGLERLISATNSLLGLMSFLTAGEDEVRAWTIPMNSTAVKAAGAIHTDFEKKFIRAEVVNWQALIDHDGYAGAREKGLLRLEGKDYIVRDGDVLVIRHS